MWVMVEDGRFHAWYCGWKGPYNQQRSTLVELGYATSRDGVHWEKYEGNPIFTERWVEDICVVKSGDTYYMYCEDESFKRTVIHLLTSKDKIHWTAQGNVLEKVRGSDWEADWVGTPLVWKEAGRWIMLYEGGTPGDVALAFSQDGRQWTRSEHNPVFTNAAGRAWDNQITAADSIVKRGEVYHLFYHACGGPWQTGIAVSSDLVHWTRFEDNPISRDHSAVVVDAGNQYFLYMWDGRHDGAVNLFFSRKK
jgi:predicted GH43/DUF377 family glycosyl hydrolase